jgi:hypothetical protein
VRPWLDQRSLALGDEWESEIKKAVVAADIFLVCLRPGFDGIGFRQKEVRWALEAVQLRPPGRGFIVPVIIKPCELPDWCQPFHAGDTSKPTDLEDILRAIKKHLGAKFKPDVVLQLEGKNFSLPQELRIIQPKDLPLLVEAIKQIRYEEWKKARIAELGGIVPMWTGH